MTDRRWIFDTNTLISALFNSESTSARALVKARASGKLLICTETSSEYFSVFTRNKFDRYLSLETRIGFLENVLANANTVEITEVVTVCRDPKDNCFLSLAVSAAADAIISGDSDLLSLRLTMMFPSFLRLNFYFSIFIERLHK